LLQYFYKKYVAAYLENMEFKKRNKLIETPFFHLILIVLLGSLAYSNTFNAPFTFDDYIAIVNNPIIRNFDFFKSPFSNVNVNLTESYKVATRTRLLGFFSFAINYHWHKLDVTGYHIVNLVIHLLNGILLYFFVRELFKTPYFAKITKKGTESYIPIFVSLLFTLHPIQTQAVTYVTQRFVALASFFFLLSILFYTKRRLISGRKSIFYFIISLFSAIFAMYSKEIAFTLPIILVLYEFFFFRGTNKERLILLLPYLLTMFIIPLTMIFSRHIYSNNTDVILALKTYNQQAQSISSFDYLFTQFRVIVTYLRLLVLPINQNLDYDYPIYNSFFLTPVISSFLFLLGIFATAIYFYINSRNIYSYNRVYSFAILWFFITLSVESSIIPIDDVIFEHRVYLPSIGFFIFFVFSFLTMFNKIFKMRLTLLCIILIMLLSATYLRNKVWMDEKSLWHDIAEKSPRKARVWVNLANAYRDQPVKQKIYLEKALSLNPFYPLYYVYYSRALFANGEYQQGLNWLKKTLSFGYKENLVKEILDMGKSLLNAGKTETAVECFKLVLSTPYYKDEALAGLNLAQQQIKK